MYIPNFTAIVQKKQRENETYRHKQRVTSTTRRLNVAVLTRSIANSSRVSCAHNTLMPSIITLSPWNLGQGSLKVTGNLTTG